MTKSINSKRYAQELSDYYIALKHVASRIFPPDLEMDSWDRDLIAVSKLPSPAKENSFVQAVLSAEKRLTYSLHNQRASEYECS